MLIEISNGKSNVSNIPGSPDILGAEVDSSFD